MKKRLATGNYYRNIIKTIEGNLESLENNRIRYGRFRRYITGIDKNINQRRNDLYYYERVLKRYIDEGWAI